MAIKPQNKTHAVMAQRFEPIDSPDDFPTPPWATRALFEHVLGGKRRFSGLSCLEPACGVGHMSNVLLDYFGDVYSADAFYYGYGTVRDFLGAPLSNEQYDWVVTNPPFRLAESFVLRGLQIARGGVAILARTVFIESVGRYAKLFHPFPPTYFVQFCERVPMVKGRLDAKATTATGYCWLVWDKQASEKCVLKWIPKTRRSLEKESDYIDAPLPRKISKSFGNIEKDLGSQLRLKV